MHDHINELSNDVRSSYWYEDYQSYESARSSNWFEDRESCCLFKLKVSNILRFESEISLFDSNE
jgi:hypothetical protein